MSGAHPERVKLDEFRVSSFGFRVTGPRLLFVWWWPWAGRTPIELNGVLGGCGLGTGVWVGQVGPVRPFGQIGGRIGRLSNRGTSKPRSRGTFRPQPPDPSPQLSYAPPSPALRSRIHRRGGSRFRVVRG
jgi:hypothetical protein